MFEFFERTKKNVKAYRDFLKDSGVQEVKSWEDIPICDKQNYLLKYPMAEMTKDDISKAFLIGTSSGFSNSGSVFWLKEATDEEKYLKAVRELLVDNYGIDKKKTLVIVSLAFGTWIGGMQLATTFRNLATSMKNLTVATPGLDLNEAVQIAKEFGSYYDTILWVVNPSSINIIYSLLKDEKSLLDKKVVFPVVGEYFSENFREEVALKFGHDKNYPFALRTGYGSADAGDLGIESKETIVLRKFLNNNIELCKELFLKDEAPMMFVKNDKALFEFIDGEIIVTKDQFIPLIRYNTKDCGGMLKKEKLKKIIEKDLYKKLPQEILYVFGRVSDSIVFYGTNLNIIKIGDFLSSLKNMEYAGLFEVSEEKDGDISFFKFDIYVYDIKDGLEEVYLKKLLNFLKSSSKEFVAKYAKLCSATKKDLIRIELKLIQELKIDKKHKYYTRIENV